MLNDDKHKIKKINIDIKKKYVYIKYYFRGLKKSKTLKCLKKDFSFDINIDLTCKCDFPDPIYENNYSFVKCARCKKLIRK